MSSISYNLKRKLEWMGRRLRKINKAEDIMKWISAMREINSLLKEVDIKEYKDTWRPWSVQRGKDEGTIDQRASTRPNLKSGKMETVPQVGLVVSSDSDLTNNDELKMHTAKVRSRPPRVEIEGDDIEMNDPKNAVMKMLRDAKDQQEKNKPQGERGLVEKKKNKEIYRNGMLERVMKAKVPVEYWGDIRSDNFLVLIGECAPHRVRVAVIEDMGFHEVQKYLYNELKRFYELNV